MELGPGQDTGSEAAGVLAAEAELDGKPESGVRSLPQQGRWWHSSAHDLGLRETLICALTHPVRAGTPKAGPTQAWASERLLGDSFRAA